ncbi:hypothetical protein LWF15_30775 [Kineosporia rhizophila]|uniref:hypothetical protein n=1 Tax=Kineosporia rhizophila TaxID=84633 RepID=UPI000A93A003|nr:hypothetical protein [Kineosporia rhizophila]MCE0539889.1 hypothetical protein [Kineosporia rhizophila]
MSNEWHNAPVPRHANPGQYEAGPAPQYYGGPHYQPHPPKKSHKLRNTLLVLTGLFVVGGLGSCAAVVLVAGNAVDEAVTAVEEGDAQPGGPDNPLEIEIRKAFEVNGFEYHKGWKATPDALGSVDVRKLRVTNNRGDKDSALVDIKFWKGTEVVATSSCTSDPIDVGTTVSLSCFSADDWAKGYDRITINDTF